MCKLIENNSRQRSQQLQLFSISSCKSILRIDFLKLVKLGEFLKLLCSLDHNIGPKYRSECLPYFTVFTVGILKSLFLKL